jgi:hypothetical protein
VAKQDIYIRIDKLKELATSSGHNPRTIIKEVLSGLSEEAKSLLSSQESLRGIINRVRKRVDAKSLSEVLIPESLHLTIDGTEFYYTEKLHYFLFQFGI